MTEQKKKRHIFLWVFLAVQVLFLIWIITGATSSVGPETDCGSLSQQACNDAASVGTGIGVALIIGVWFGTDLFMGLVYGIYRLAKRP